MLFPVSDWKKFNMFFEEKPPIDAEDKINKGHPPAGDLYFISRYIDYYKRATPVSLAA